MTRVLKKVQSRRIKKWKERNGVVGFNNSKDGGRNIKADLQPTAFQEVGSTH
jgi:hypothetical protein